MTISTSAFTKTNLRLQPAEGGGANPLNFTMQHQTETEWCWAANSCSVGLFYDSDSGWTQCKVANKTLNRTDCCDNPGSADCNKAYYLNMGLDTVGHWSQWTQGKATMSQVESEINGGRPLCFRIAWNAGGAHFIAIYGYSGENINLGDPWYGNSIQPYSTLTSTYHGGGTWTGSYWTKA